MTDYIQVARSELIRQQRIDELMDQLQREKARSKRYKNLIEELAGLPSMEGWWPVYKDKLRKLISRAQDIAAEE